MIDLKPLWVCSRGFWFKFIWGLSGVAVAGALLPISTGCSRTEQKTTDALPPSSVYPDRGGNESHSSAPEEATQPKAETNAPDAPTAEMETASKTPASTEKGFEIDSEAAQQQAPPTTGERTSVDPTAGVVLEGLRLAPPGTWEVAPVTPSPMGPIAVYSLPDSHNQGSDLQIRIFHYPNMKGMDDMNVDRWVGMVTRPDGTPCTRADAKIVHGAKNGVAVTLVDVSGKVSTSMGSMTPGEMIEEGRMIAAILNHPKGPHFIRVAGRANAIEANAEAIFAFIHSGEVR